MTAKDTPQKTPTPCERLLGFYRAMADCEPLMLYIGANTRLLVASDVGRTAADVIFELLQKRGDEITFDDDDAG
jgi:hypothetical protein